MTDKRFELIWETDEMCNVFDNDLNVNSTISVEDVVDLLNELYEEVERFDMFKTTVAIAIQHRINWLKKQCWDNTDRIDELESLKKELKL